MRMLADTLNGFDAKLSELRGIDADLNKKQSSTTSRRLARRLAAIAKDSKFTNELLESFLEAGCADHPDLLPVERLFILKKNERPLSTYLVRSLNHHSSNRRRAAAWLLANLAPESATSAFLRHARASRDQEVKGYALKGVLTIAFNSRALQKKGVPLAIKATRSNSPLTRAVAYNFLELFGGPNAGPALRHAFHDKDSGLRAVASCYYDNWAARQKPTPQIQADEKSYARRYRS